MSEQQAKEIVDAHVEAARKVMRSMRADPPPAPRAARASEGGRPPRPSQQPRLSTLTMALRRSFRARWTLTYMGPRTHRQIARRLELLERLPRLWANVLNQQSEGVS